MSSVSKVAREMVEGKFVVNAVVADGQVTLVFNDDSTLSFTAANVSGGTKTVQDISLNNGSVVVTYTDGSTGTIPLPSSGGSGSIVGAVDVLSAKALSNTVTITLPAGRYYMELFGGYFSQSASNPVGTIDGVTVFADGASIGDPSGVLECTVFGSTTLTLTATRTITGTFTMPGAYSSGGSHPHIELRAIALMDVASSGSSSTSISSAGITPVENFQSPTLVATPSVSKNVSLGAPYTGRLVAICLYVWRNANIIWDITDVSIGGKSMTRLNTGFGSNNRAVAGIYVLPEETLDSTTLTVTTNSTLIMWGYHIFTLSGASATPNYVFEGSGDIPESGPWAFPVNAVQNNRTLAFLWNYFPDSNAQGQFVFSNLKNSQTSISRWTTNENISSTVGYANLPVGNPSLAYAWGQSATYDGVFKLVASFPPN